MIKEGGEQHKYDEKHHQLEYVTLLGTFSHIPPIFFWVPIIGPLQYKVYMSLQRLCRVRLPVYSLVPNIKYLNGSVSSLGTLSTAHHLEISFFLILFPSSTVAIKEQNH